MSPKRIVSDVLEKILGRFYEGQRTPRRFLEGPAAFAKAAPSASAAEWAAAAEQMIDDAYRAGYVRGLEADRRAKSEWRSPQQDEMEEALARLADEHAPYPWRTEFEMGSDDPLRGVPNELRAVFLRQLSQAQNLGYVVVRQEDRGA